MALSANQLNRQVSAWKREFVSKRISEMHNNTPIFNQTVRATVRLAKFAPKTKAALHHQMMGVDFDRTV